MTADQHADVNIECNEVAAASVPILERVTCPVWFVLATGDSLGTKGGEMELGRTVLDPILARNPNLKVSTKVASNHAQYLRKDSPAVARPSASSSPPAATRSAEPCVATMCHFAGGWRSRSPSGRGFFSNRRLQR